MAEQVNYTVGIDFGYSSIRTAIFKGKNSEEDTSIEILRNDLGNLFTPSFIGFENSKVIIGENAISHKSVNVENVIYGIKRLMGRIRDETFNDELKELPFSVDVSNDKLKVIVTSDNQKSVYSPEEITALLLITIKNKAEEHLKVEVNSVVISVPPNFRNSQRQSIIDSALISGFKDVKLMSDTVALTLKHLWQNESNRNDVEKKKLLVVSVGGGYTSISIIESGCGCIEVKDHCIKQFGGSQFDKYFYSHILNLLPNQSDLSDKAKRNLLMQCEACKIALSSSTESTIVIDEIMEENFNHVEKVTRQQFEEACDELFVSIFNKIMETVEKANFNRREINEVLLVGGSTRIPKILSFFSESFPNAEVYFHTEDSVAIGCSLYSKILNTKLYEITDLSTFWYCVEYNNCNLIIERNSKVPATMEGVIFAKADNERNFALKVIEVNTNSGTIIGDFNLQTKNDLKNGSVAFNIQLHLDSNGALNVTAFEAITNRKFALYVKSRLSRDEIKWMRSDAEKMRDVMKAEKTRLRVKLSLENIISECQQSMSDFAKFVDEYEVNEAENFLNLVSNWIQISEYSCEEYHSKITEVDQYFTTLLSNRKESNLELQC